MKETGVRKQIELGEKSWSKGKIEEALKIFEDIDLKSASHFEQAEILNNIGIMYKTKGFYKKAENIVLESLKIKEKLRPFPVKEYIHSKNNLAMIERILGNYELTEQIYLELLELTEKNIDELLAEHNNILNNLGVFYMVLGVYENSEKHLLQALEERQKEQGENSQKYAETLNNLAYLYTKTKEYNKALKIFEKTLSILREIGMHSHLAYYRTLKNYCSVLYETGEKIKAKEILEKILNNSDDEKLKNTLEYASYLREYANMVRDESNQADSKLYDRALEIIYNQAGIETLEYTKTLSDKSKMYTIQKKEEEAYRTLTDSVNIQNKILKKIIFRLGENEALELLNSMNTEHDLLLSSLMRSFRKDPVKIAETHRLLSVRKSMILEITAIQNLMMRNVCEKKESAPEIQKKFNEWKELKIDMASSTVENKMKKESEIKKLEKFLLGKIHNIDIQNKLKEIDCEEIKKALSHDEILMDIYQMLEQNRYLMFVIKKNDTIRIYDLGEANILNDLIAEYRKSISDSIYEAEAEKLSKKLFKIFFSFLKNRQEKNYEIPGKITICATGEITKLPFETLYTEEDSYLIEETHVKYLTSLKDIVKVSVPGDKKNIALIIDPDYDYPQKNDTGKNKNDVKKNAAGFLKFGSKDFKFPRLEGTQLEGKIIVELLAKENWEISDYLTGEKATDRKVKNLKSPKTIHIASHGFFHETKTKTNPLMNSGLVLTGINTVLSDESTLTPKEKEEIEDGIITAYDITNMNLENTDLVILSACETGLGKIVPGSGVIGLQRAFFLAGVKTIIMTLWEISDKESVKLMKSFYEKYLKTDDAEESLRKAKIELIDTLYREKGYADPYLWGGYICLSREFQGTEKE